MGCPTWQDGQRGPALASAMRAREAACLFLWCSAVHLSTLWHVHPAGWCSAWTAGIEPATTGFGDQRSPWLSYVHMYDANETARRACPLRAASGRCLHLYPEATSAIRAVPSGKDAGMLAYRSSRLHW